MPGYKEFAAKGTPDFFYLSICSFLIKVVFIGKPGRLWFHGLPVCLALVLSGCQRVFTTSLLSFLQRDPADLPPEQQIAWAEQALASGDREAMIAAYDAIKDIKDLEGASYLAANLAMELSGVSAAFSLTNMEEILSIETDAELEDYLDDFLDAINGSYVNEAGAQYQEAMAENPDQFSGQDVVLGALSLAFGPAVESGDFGSASPGNAAEANSFITDGLSAMPEDDPAREILEQMQFFINSSLFYKT